MAVNKGFSVDFNGFLGLAEEISEAYGDTALLNATAAALLQTKEYVNGEVRKALDSSKYSFDEGVGYSQGKAKASLEKVEEMPVEIEGTTVTAYAGVDLNDAPEVLILAYGAPHLEKDTNLYNAIKVKGKVKKRVEQIQKEIFIERLRGDMRNL